MHLPLARQILLPMVGILLLAAAAASAVSAWVATVQVQHRLERQLEDVARTLSATNFPLETSVLRQTRGLTGAEYVLIDAAGVVVAATSDDLRPAADGSLPPGKGFDASRLIAAGGRSYFQAAVSIDRRPVGGQALVLHVFYPEADWREARWQATWPPLAIGGAASLLVGLVAYFVAARVTRPIGELRAQVARIAQGDFTAMPLPRTSDEVQDLARAVNQMAQRLAQYEDQTRRSERLRTLGTLGGGIAHQIRNAATGCRIALDLHHRDCPLAASGASDGEPLAVAVRQLELIETHVRRFLTLGQPSTSDREATDLVGVVQQAISLVTPMAEHVGAGIRFQRPPEPIVLTADGEALVQMVLNLLVNAVQAASGAKVAAGPTVREHDAEVVVRVQCLDDGRCHIAVGDAGPGPAAAMQDRLFEPFATDKPGGTGLGLVVTRRIAEDHGGLVRWERKEGRTWFLVELPLTPDP